MNENERDNSVSKTDSSLEEERSSLGLLSPYDLESWDLDVLFCYNALALWEFLLNFNWAGNTPDGSSPNLRT